MSFWCHRFDQNSNENIVRISAVIFFVASWGLPGDLESNIINKKAYRKPLKASRKPQGSFSNFQVRNPLNIFVGFLVETMTPKSHFEIKWPLLHILTFPNGISGFQSWSSLDSVSDKVCSKCCTPFVLTCVCWSVDADFCFRAWQYLNHLQKSVFTTEEMSLIDNKKTLKMSQTPYKGQLISKCPCCVKTSSKTTTKFFPGFLP